MEGYDSPYSRANIIDNLQSNSRRLLLRCKSGINAVEVLIFDRKFLSVYICDTISYFLTLLKEKRNVYLWFVSFSVLPEKFQTYELLKWT